MSISNVQIIDAMAQCRADHKKWVDGVKRIEPFKLEANLAGFDAGWRAAVSYLKLHGALKTVDGRAP